jgi:type I restriction enzyme R subunit
MATVADALQVKSLSSQQTLVAGMLRPEHLLDIIRNFTLFQTSNGETRKLVCRYQQFRAVQLAVQRMLSGKTRIQDGEHDRRGGIIWHTQGTGKSLTMIYLVRKMRSLPELRGFKIVVVTDRRDLEEQLRETAALTGEPLTVIKSEQRGYQTISGVKVLKEALARSGKDLVFAMIQKYRAERANGLEVHEPDPDSDEEVSDEASEPFPVLNEDPSILVLVDEAHRSHTNTFHSNLHWALPNCVRIGFTGTPILMGAKKKTAEIFGPFIDRYTIQQAQKDGAVVPIYYEGRTSDGAVAGGGKIDRLFDDLFVERTKAERKEIKDKYATKPALMSAERLIAEKARDMLRHYIQRVLPNGFKAQVVAVDRRAAVRYQGAFLDAQKELVLELEGLDAGLLALSAEKKAKLDPDVQFLVDAHRFLDTIKELEFATVISGSHNDPEEYREWTDATKSENRRTRFKRPLVHEDPEKRDPLAFLIVKSMLLTGFDAPFEQVMYLDRPIREAELLQAIARVNRTCGPSKKAGLVVDYYGVARHLKEALDVYSAEDIEGALQNLQDLVPVLRNQHHRVLAIFLDRGLRSLSDTEGCVQVLRDERVWTRFSRFHSWNFSRQRCRSTGRWETPIFGSSATSRWSWWIT